jgi:predicted nucleotidyltransferase component of viral defense system
MIEKQEIDAKADELGVHVANVQRDHVYGWLLAGLAQTENWLRPSLILKGGNCFRRYISSMPGFQMTSTSQQKRNCIPIRSSRG